MRYYLVERQRSGCDFSIGCGIRITLLPASSLTDAVQQAVAGIDENWRDDSGQNDCAIDNAEILAVEHVENLEGVLDAWKADKQKRQETARRAHVEAKEAAEYERLKKKFEVFNP